MKNKTQTIFQVHKPVKTQFNAAILLDILGQI